MREPIIRADGYVLVWMPDHPDAHGGRVYEHRAVAEAKIGRRLTRHDIVHHVNENRSDNRPENLEVVTKGWHQSHHLGSTALTDDEIKERLREGWSYVQFIELGIWQHRVSRCRRELSQVCDYCGRLTLRKYRACPDHDDLPAFDDRYLLTEEE